MQWAFFPSREICLLKTLCGKSNLQIQECANLVVHVVALGVADVLIHFQDGSHISNYCK